MCICCYFMYALTAAGSAAPGAAKLPQGGHGDAAGAQPRIVKAATDQSLLLEAERAHLKNIRQLTFGHDAEHLAGAQSAANYAEAYWAPDGKSLILQSTRNQYACDQQFTLDITTGALKLVSTGAGRVTCGFFTPPGWDGAAPGQSHVLFASTHESMGAECPPPADMSLGYVWAIYPYDIYSGDGQGGPLRNLTSSPGYDAEATVDWNTGWMYYTSTRNGDLDIYRMNLNTGENVQLTDELGYDGGPFVSYDGRYVLYRRSFLNTEEARQDYKDLLAKELVRPSQLEIMVMDADGSNKRRLTGNNAANFAPFLHPDGEHVIFCSNLGSQGAAKGRAFDLYTIPLSSGSGNELGSDLPDGPKFDPNELPYMDSAEARGYKAPAVGQGYAKPERITWTGEFEGFPMFSPDGKYLVWCGNRNGAMARETNVFVAEWMK